MNIKGKLISISETNQISDKFSKREFVVEFAENPQYPEYIQLEFVQDKCDILNEYSIGQDVDVAFNLKGRKWTNPQGVDKYFNTLQAWKIDKAGDVPSPSQEDDTDDLPF